MRGPNDEAVKDAIVNVRCEGLKPDEGLTTRTDASGSFTMTTAGGALPDACVVHVNEGAAPPVTTTIGAAKATGDDPANRVRNVRVTLPSQP